MTRREKILLQICIAIGLIGLSSVYLLQPSIAERQSSEAALGAMELEELQIKTVLDAQGVEEALEKQQSLAEQNYEYFYGELNSYTIDGILNQIIEECGLEIQSLNIGDYVKVDAATLVRNQEAESATDDETEDDKTEEEKAEEEFLLGCRVTLNVTGDYDQILSFSDALKKESTCIEVSSINVQTNERSVEEARAVVATAELLIYGIEDTIPEGKDE